MTTTIVSTKWHFQARKDFIICGTSLSTTTAPILASYQYSKWRVSIIFVGDPSPHCMHWGNHIDINTSLFEGINTQTGSIPATPQYSKCIHTGNTSIPKLHPYWQQIYTQNTSIFHIVITSIPKLHPYQQHINWPKIHPYRYNIHTQDASILASHQFPKCIHIGITSIPKGGATLASTCASSVTPTLLAPFPSNQPLLVAELLSKEKEINIVHLHLKESC